MAVAGWEAALELSREKGPAPIMNEEFTVTEGDAAQASGDGEGRLAGRGRRSPVACCTRATAATCSASREVAPQLVHELAEVGARFTHHTSIAPTGTISLSLANNASQRHRAVVRASLLPQRDPRRQEDPRRKIDVFSFELLAYRELVNPKCQARSHRPMAKDCRTTSSPSDDSHSRRACRHPGCGPEVGRFIDFQDGERAYGFPLRELQGHLSVCTRAGPEGLHHVPLQPGSLPGRAREGSRT